MCAHRSIKKRSKSRFTWNPSLYSKEVRNSSFTVFKRLLGKAEHLKDTAPPCTGQKPFLLSFSTAFWSQTGRKKQSGQKRVEKVNKNCIWSVKGKTAFLKCSFLLNYRLKTVRDEFLTSFDYNNGFHVNLLFDRFFIDRCAHIWVTTDQPSSQIVCHHCNWQCNR